MDKQSIRKQVQATLTAMDAVELRRRSEKVCERISRLEEFRRAEVVMAYLPIVAEVDVEPLILHAWDAGKTVLAPRVHWKHRRITPTVLNSLRDGLAEGRYGVREPLGGEVFDIERIDLVIVPAVAYDRSGNRLGRGAGFYDRFLASCRPATIACGAAFDEQVLEKIPVTDNDMPVDLIVTDTEVLRFSGRGTDRAATQERNG
ncbi:MAG: 5-formyltetrahydrofolate cyclo-ligase [Phycisphaerae bacterium]